MKRCEHKHVEARIWSQYFKDWKVIPGTMMAINPDALICRDCGEWLGLGESDEQPVADEVRAAELAADNSLGCPSGFPGEWFECHGCGARNWTDGSSLDAARYTSEWWAGYLAETIATHSEPQ